jgi:hypothetical protein
LFSILTDRVEAGALLPQQSMMIFFIIEPMILTGPPESSEVNHCIILPEQTAVTLLPAVSSAYSG